MQPTNKMFPVKVSALKVKLGRLLNQYKIKNVYFSDHFHARAVERNIDNKSNELFMLALLALKDMALSTSNTTRYKVSGKGVFIIAKISVGTVTGVRKLIVQTCYDIDIFNADRYDTNLKY